MSWNDLDSKQDNAAVRERAEQDEQTQQALEAACAESLAHYPVLEQYLRRLVYSTSYAPGRSAEDVAYCEGTRGLAARLLNFGGKTP